MSTICCSQLVLALTPRAKPKSKSNQSFIMVIDQHKAKEVVVMRYNGVSVQISWSKIPQLSHHLGISALGKGGAMHWSEGKQDQELVYIIVSGTPGKSCFKR